MVSKSSVFCTIILLSATLYCRSQVSFTQQVIDTSIKIGYGLAIADVDGDGKMDILLADSKQFVWYRNGDWKKFVMAENLTEYDNVCIAARDINRDGKAEVAVGAQWNPGETRDDKKSGAVFYLVRPKDPTQPWKPIELQHEPTVHRMQWVKSITGQFKLVMAPLHGRGNKNGEGVGSKILAYQFIDKPDGNWKVDTVEGDMHLTHNFFKTEEKNGYNLFIAGKEGIVHLQETGKKIIRKNLSLPGMTRGAGEIVIGKSADSKTYMATIEPMHGNELAVYSNNYTRRILLDTTLKDGHAIGVADFLQLGYDQILAGWRYPDKQGNVGIKIYILKDKSGSVWEQSWIDLNGMACEDLKIADLNGDNKPDIVASGRATHNVKIYWNQ
jgi:FG-GAP-like repeat